jgi:hypothetical protein
MTVTKRKAPSKRVWKPCHNGCTATRNGAKRGATHEAWIIGWPTYLCARCAKAWAEAWEGAKCSAA